MQAARNRTSGCNFCWPVRWARTHAHVAQRAHKLPQAEICFRQCLTSGPAQKIDLRVYAGLVGVLMVQKKYSDVVSFCTEQLSSRIGGIGLDGFFHSEIAAAQAEL